MAAYAAVISLKHTINSLINSCPISTQEFLNSAYYHATSLQKVLKKLDDSSSRSRSSRKRLEVLDAQVRDRAKKLEDVLEYYELNDFNVAKQKHGEEEVSQEVSRFIKTAKMMEKEYVEELSRDDDDDDGDEDDAGAAVVSSNIDSGMEMVGYADDFIVIQNLLRERKRPDDLFIFALYGEEGSGKTRGARIIFEGEKQAFDCWAWVTIGMNHDPEQVLIRILAQVDNIAAWEYERLASGDVKDLVKYLRAQGLGSSEIHDRVGRCRRRADGRMFETVVTRSW